MRLKKHNRGDRYLLLVFMFSILLSFSLYQNTNSKFKKGIDINVHGKTGSIVCDSALSYPGGTSEAGYDHFLVNIKNFDNNVTSGIPISYKLTIKNKGEVNTLFRFNDPAGVKDDEFKEVLEIGKFNVKAATQDVDVLDVEVKSVSGQDVTANFDVSVDCFQEGNNNNLIMDGELAYPGTVSAAGYDNFNILLRNYTGNNLTSVGIKYKVTVENINGSTAVYRDINTGEEFSNKLVTKAYTMGKASKEDQTLNIEVETADKKNGKAEFKVTVEAYELGE